MLRVLLINHLQVTNMKIKFHGIAERVHPQIVNDNLMGSFS